MMIECLHSHLATLAVIFGGVPVSCFVVYRTTRKTWEKHVRDLMAIYTVRDDMGDGAYIVLGHINGTRMEDACRKWAELEYLR